MRARSGDVIQQWTRSHVSRAVASTGDTTSAGHRAGRPGREPGGGGRRPSGACGLSARAALAHDRNLSRRPVRRGVERRRPGADPRATRHAVSFPRHGRGVLGPGSRDRAAGVAARPRRCGSVRGALVRDRPRLRRRNVPAPAAAAGHRGARMRAAGAPWHGPIIDPAFPSTALCGCTRSALVRSSTVDWAAP